MQRIEIYFDFQGFYGIWTKTNSDPGTSCFVDKKKQFSKYM